jgi:DNA-binding MarR family transcriptional regulator
LEYLLNLAYVRASALDAQAVLRQIVESRERGFDLIRKLATVPEAGITAGDLANAMRISPQNLSPLLTDFHASGVIHREKRGKSVFVTLTPEGRALVDAPDPAPLAVVENRFLKAPMKQPRREVSPRKAA